MRAEEEVYAGLSGDAAITALVATRIYPDLAAQSVSLPLIVFERRATQPIVTIHDDLPAASKVSISASAWAKNRLEAEQIADAIQIALRMIGISVNRFAHYDPDTAAHAAVVDFDVWEL